MSKTVKRVRRKRVKRMKQWEILRALSTRVVVGGTIATVVAVALMLIYLPKAYGSWRESRLLKQAAALLEQNDYREASRTAHEALSIRPDSLQAYKILAEATEKQNRADTVTWRAQIARLQPRDLDSQLNLASAALRFGQLDTARKTLESVPEQDRHTAAYHVVAGWLARAQGDDAGVQRHFAEAVNKEPANETYQFNLAVIEIASSDKEKSGAAREALLKLSKATAFRTGALRALLSDAISRDDLESADRLAHELQMSQQVTFADYLLCLDFYRKLDPKKAAALLEKVKPVAERTPGDLALLMEWMIRSDLPGEAIKWMEKLKPEVANAAPPAIAVAEAFTELKNWSRLRRWTRNRTWSDAEYLRLAYQAYAARQSRQGSNDAEFNSLWQSAEEAASGEAEREAKLARLASKWNLAIEAEQLWLRVSKHAPMRREALNMLARSYRTRNDLPNLYRTMQRLHESSPNEPGVAADYARLALLLEHNAAEGHRIAKEVYEKASTDVNCAVTYAFSLYGLGRTSEGIEVLRKLKPEQLKDPHSAVYAAVLFLDENQFDAAKEFIVAAQDGSIYPEEKRLLDEALVKLPPTPRPEESRGPVAPSPAPVQPATPPPPR